MTNPPMYNVASAILCRSLAIVRSLPLTRCVYRGLGNKLLLSKSKAPSKDKRYLLTSYNANDVTEREPHDDKGIAGIHFASSNRMLQAITRCKLSLHPFEYPIKTLVNSEIM